MVLSCISCAAVLEREVGQASDGGFKMLGFLLLVELLSKLQHYFSGSPAAIMRSTAGSK